MYSRHGENVEGSFSLKDETPLVRHPDRSQENTYGKCVTGYKHIHTATVSRATNEFCIKIFTLRLQVPIDTKIEVN